MKTSRKLLASAVAASVLGLGALAPVAQAEVSASMGIANIYLWRGIDLSAGQGTPSVNGSLDFSEGGFYAGIWGGSGDASGGTEYDLYAGFGGEVGGFTYDLSLWSYQYPTATTELLDDQDVVVLGTDGLPVMIDASNDIGDLMEGVISLGFGPVSLTYYEGLQDLEDYYYVTLGATFDKFSVTYGKHKDSMSHVDLGYAFNDNISFKVSQVVDDMDGAFDDDLNFVVALGLSIE